MNIAHRHRHGRAWSGWLIDPDHTEPEAQPHERDHNARATVIELVVLGWLLLILVLVAG